MFSCEKDEHKSYRFSFISVDVKVPLCKINVIPLECLRDLKIKPITVTHS